MCVWGGGGGGEGATCVVVKVEDYSFHPGIVSIARIIYIASIHLL